MKKGILLFAAGKPVYGRYAYNLSLSLKIEDPDIPVVVLYDELSVFSELSEDQQEVFDFKIPVKKSDLYYEGVFMPSRFKTYINEYTPFEETIFLDVDSLFFPGKKISWLFSELSNYDFTSFSDRTHKNDNEKSKLMTWCYISDIRKVFGLKGKISEVNSHFIYFKNNNTTDKFFKKSQEIYNSLLCKEKDIEIELWSDQIPDELCFSIASNLTNLHPHKENWRPTIDYWKNIGEGSSNLFYEIFLLYWGMTLPGEVQGRDFVGLYNFTMKYVQKRSGKSVFLWDGEKFGTKEKLEENAVTKENPQKRIIG